MKPRLTILLLTGIPLVWLFGPALGGGSSFAFRDAAHFYHPLFQYIRQEWGAGRVPLWNPYENLGVPLVAENTSSVFYPGKLLFALPLDYTWLYNVYIVSHIVLAAANSYALARHLRATRFGALFGSLSYAFSGSVLFQYCNVIFLVGAAWLPLAWLSADRALRQRSIPASIGFGLTLALMVLGGDPQIAYNTALVAGGYAALLWRSVRRDLPAQDGSNSRNWRTARPLLLAISLVSAALLAAIQVLPTLEASPYSARSRFDSPRNLYEFVQRATDGESDDGEAIYQGLLGGSPRGHHAEIYYFSLEPWRAIEFVWPNVTGRPFPTDRRWLSAFNLEGNLWTPSLYMGLLPLLLSLGCLSVRRRAPVEVRGLSWLVLFGVLGSFGWYGGGWLVGQFVGDPQSFGVGGEVGGLYWWLAMLLPGYIQFRYPAKLFVLASLGLSMLAARGWDGLWSAERPRIPRSLLVVPVVSVAAAVLVWVVWPYAQEHISNAEPDKWLGPFDWNGAWTDLVDGLLHGLVVSLALVFLFWLRGRVRHERLLQFAVLAVVAVDLASAQQGLLEYAPSNAWSFRPLVLDRLPPEPTTYRVFRQLGPLPQSFRQQTARDRYVQGLCWDRETLWPKYPLPLGVSLAEVSQTVAGGDYDMMLDVARTRNRQRNRVAIPDSSVLDLVAARVALVDQSTKSQVPGASRLAESMFLGTRSGALPRAWIVHEVDVRTPPAGRSLKKVEGYTRDVLFADGQSRDWRKVAVVETDEILRLDGDPVEGAPSSSSHESCRIVAAEPSRVEISARLDSPGLLVLSDQFYPGWEATVETGGKVRPLSILRTNRVMRGVVLPPGEHRVIYRFRPRSIAYGAVVSGLAWTALGCFAGARLFQRRNLRRTAS